MRFDRLASQLRCLPLAGEATCHGAGSRAAGRASRRSERAQPTIYRFILTAQPCGSSLCCCALTLVSFPFLYYSLVLPKTIINQRNRGKATSHKRSLGIEFDQIPYLMLLCAAFLALVFINGGFKYYINTFKGRLGERMLRRFR